MRLCLLDFHHGTEAHEGYVWITEEYLKEHNRDLRK